ncbi:ethylene-responsive transcription factor WRI1 isoform X1 [Elaeis guineensis]|uniref:ethylene-responsive transcription factor WRI1 isoform X1 n=1 Tax=Elaeis guineensis var. tenera TaxID=51953 RepID=UPI003C6D77B6
MASVSTIHHCGPRNKTNQRPLRSNDSHLKKEKGKRTSIYRGVTRHKWTGKYEAHIWDKDFRHHHRNKKGKQGVYNDEEAAAHAYDLAALKYLGSGTVLNFPEITYLNECQEMQSMSKNDYVAYIRRNSNGFTRGASKYRGVARHHSSRRWEARIHDAHDNKNLFLGTFETQEEAAKAYDLAVINYRGSDALTNFPISNYLSEHPTSSQQLPVPKSA